MYNDYDVIYKSNLNEYFGIMVVFGIIAFILLIFTIFSLSKVFKKANRSGIAPWIPIYNMYLLVEIANLPILYFILLFVPFANIYAMYKISVSMAALFKKNKIFGIGLFLLPFIFYPLLAFSDSEYIGINLFALEGKTTVEDIPVIDQNKTKEIEVKVNDNYDISSRNINISIGGGKYQKDYTANLVDVDREKVVNKVEAEENPNRQNIFINNLPEPEIPNTTVETNTINNNAINMSNNSSELFNVPFINTQNNEQIEQNKSTLANVNSANNVASQTSSIAEVKKSGDYSLCPNCGTRVADNAKICFVCGQQLK